MTVLHSTNIKSLSEYGALIWDYLVNELESIQRRSLDIIIT